MIQRFLFELYAFINGFFGVNTACPARALRTGDVMFVRINSHQNVFSDHRIFGVEPVLQTHSKRAKNNPLQFVVAANSDSNVKLATILSIQKKSHNTGTAIGNYQELHWLPIFCITTAEYGTIECHSCYSYFLLNYLVS